MSRFIKSFGFAGKGIYTTFKTQPNFRFHCISTALVVVAGWYFQLQQSEWLWLVAAISMVLVTELINTAIETLVDFVSPGYHQKAGQVKDAAAAAVLVAAIAALIIGLLIFIPKLI